MVSVGAVLAAVTLATAFLQRHWLFPLGEKCSVQLALSALCKRPWFQPDPGCFGETCRRVGTKPLLSEHTQCL